MTLRRLLAASCAFISLPAHAELGRLFFTPQKRAELDHARKHQISESQSVTPPAITLNGIIKGPDGHSTLWVNGTPVQHNAITGGLHISAGSDAATATFKPVSGTRGNAQSLKVGDKLNTRAEP